MRCPYCSSPSTRVVDSRLSEPEGAVRRRRACSDCGKRFTTYERAEEAPVTVLKRDGGRELFDRLKLLRGLARAAGKRPVSEEQLEELVDAIAAEVRAGGAEVRAEQLGDLAERGLARIDPVAAIQFASVYRNLADLDELEAVVRSFKQQAAAQRESEDGVLSGGDLTMDRSPYGGNRALADTRRSHVRQP